MLLEWIRDTVLRRIGVKRGGGRGNVCFELNKDQTQVPAAMMTALG